MLTSIERVQVRAEVRAQVEQDRQAGVVHEFVFLQVAAVDVSRLHGGLDLLV